MLFTPDRQEITDTLINTLLEYIKVVQNTTRVLDFPGFDSYVKTVGSAGVSNV
jgi:hypothetical protein